MADPTIRERLRELAERSWNDEMSDLEWGHLKAQRAEFGVAVRDLIPALLDELDTLERRAIAAEEGLDAAIRHGYYRGQADERYQRGDRDELAIRLWREEERDHAAISAAISTARTALEASRGSA